MSGIEKLFIGGKYIFYNDMTYKYNLIIHIQVRKILQV